MATPTADTYSAPSGATLYAGRDEPVPTWLSGLTVGEWGVLTATTLAASGVGWAGTNPGGSDGYAGIFAYSGAVINTDGFYSGATWISGPALILWGGGHGNYAGNEVYALSLRPDTPAWYRLTDPTITAPVNQGEDASGYPVSRHTYDAISYVNTGGRNWMHAFGALFAYSVANSYSVTHVFDFDVASPATNKAWVTKTAPGGTSIYSAFEPSSGRVWGSNYTLNDVSYYDVAADTYSTAGSKSPNFGFYGCSDIDTSRGIWAIFTNNGLQGYRTNNGTANDFYTISVTGSAPASPHGFLYDDVSDKFIAWSGGKTLYTLTPPGSSPYQGGNNWTWASSTPAGGSTPTAVEATGTFGRFALVKIGSARGYLAINAENESVYFYRAA
jgi:hypothetical protein